MKEIDLAQVQAQIDAADLEPPLREGLGARASRLWLWRLTDDLAQGLRRIWETEALDRREPFVVYGAGSFLKGLLASFPESRYAPWLRGFIDRRAGQADFSDWPAPVYPPEALAELDFRLVVAFHPFAEQEMLGQIKRHAPPGVDIMLFYSGDPCRRFMTSVIADRIERLKAGLPSRQPVPSGRAPIKVALLNAYGPSIVTPSALALCRQPELEVSYLYAAALDHVKPAVMPAGARRIECRRNLWECVALIGAIDPDLIYAQDNSLYNDQLAPLIKIAFPDKPFIYEPYDLIASLYADPSTLTADGRSESDAAFAVALEDWMLRQADGVVHMDNGPQVDAAMARSDANHLEFHAYLPARQCHFHDKPGPNRPIRLAWAGGIAPASAPDRTRGENKLLPFFQSLIDQGFEVRAFNPLAADRDQLEREYPEYLAYAAAEPRFRIEPFTPREKLIEILAREADFGMHLFPKPENDQARGPMYQSSMAGKVFTYMAAGIPMLTADFLGPIARFVEGEGVGVSIAADAFGEIGQRLARCDYAALKRRVRALQPTIAAEAKASELTALIRKALGRAAARGAVLSPAARRWAE